MFINSVCNKQNDKLIFKKTFTSSFLKLLVKLSISVFLERKEV